LFAQKWLDQFPASLLDAIALHDILNTLGYSLKDELFLALNPNRVAVIIKADGKEGPIGVSPPELPLDQMREKWLELIKAWNTGGTMTKEDKDEIVCSSKIWAYRIALLDMLRRAGFTRGMKEGKPDFGRYN
jgi:hypothetical protein